MFKKQKPLSQQSGKTAGLARPNCLGSASAHPPTCWTTRYLTRALAGHEATVRHQPREAGHRAAQDETGKVHPSPELRSVSQLVLQAQDQEPSYITVRESVMNSTEPHWKGEILSLENTATVKSQRQTLAGLSPWETVPATGTKHLSPLKRLFPHREESLLLPQLKGTSEYPITQKA